MTTRSGLSGRCVAGRWRYAPWLAVSAAATAGAAVLRLSGTGGFERFLGPLPPVLTVAAAGALGIAALRYLEARGFWRAASCSRIARGLVVATVATLPFAAVAIGVDVRVGFPQGTNVAWPEAWLLYPSIAVVAETAFHLLPLAGLTWVSRWQLTGRGLSPPVWSLILATAAVEPVSQVVLRSALPAFVVPQVYAIGVVQLLLLRRYGYVPMLWFRLCYYLLWHVLWGAARLELLFEG